MSDEKIRLIDTMSDEMNGLSLPSTVTNLVGSKTGWRHSKIAAAGVIFAPLDWAHQDSVLRSLNTQNLMYRLHHSEK